MHLSSILYSLIIEISFPKMCYCIFLFIVSFVVKIKLKNYYFNKSLQSQVNQSNHPWNIIQVFGNNQVKWSDHQHLSATAAWLKSLRHCIISRLGTRRIRHPMEKMCACYQLTPGKPTLDHRLMWIITTKQERLPLHLLR